jgi:hypothetical protein
MGTTIWSDGVYRVSFDGRVVVEMIDGRTWKELPPDPAPEGQVGMTNREFAVFEALKRISEGVETFLSWPSSSRVRVESALEALGLGDAAGLIWEGKVTLPNEGVTEARVYSGGPTVKCLGPKGWVEAPVDVAMRVMAEAIKPSVPAEKEVPPPPPRGKPRDVSIP